MASKHDMMNGGEDKWVTSYMEQERRRKLTMGIGGIAVIAVVTLLVIYLFANLAPLGG